MKKEAHISNCEKYRYSLKRSWDESKGSCLFIMLNPSTADAEKDDPTIRRCINYAKIWGHGSLYVVNLFSYRSPDRSKLKEKDIAPIGEETDDKIIEHAKFVDKIICAWGNEGGFMQRGEFVVNLLKKNNFQIYYIQMSKKNQPCHPLYLKKNLIPQLLL